MSTSVEIGIPPQSAPFRCNWITSGRELGEDLDKKFKQLVCKFWSNRGNMAPGNFLFPEAPLQPCVLDISRESINGAHWKNPLDVVHTKRCPLLVMLCMASVEGLSITLTETSSKSRSSSALDGGKGGQLVKFGFAEVQLTDPTNHLHLYSSGFTTPFIEVSQWYYFKLRTFLAQFLLQTVSKSGCEGNTLGLSASIPDRRSAHNSAFGMHASYNSAWNACILSIP